jgi:cardiolipin synthase
VPRAGKRKPAIVAVRQALSVYEPGMAGSKTMAVRIVLEAGSADRDTMVAGALQFSMSTLRQFGAVPNLLTLLRLFTLPFIVIEVLDNHWKLAFALLWLAGVSDGFDGLLARWLQQRTTLGQYLDPIADKLLLSTMFLLLTHVGVIPLYVAVLVFSRDLGILLISTLLYITAALRDFRPSWLGKLNTVVQILGVLTVMTVQVAPHWQLLWVKMVLLRMIAVLAPVSAAQYAWIVMRRVQSQEPAEKAA